MTLYAEPGAVADLASTARMADLIRHLDWASTPLGARETWPPSLRVTVDLVLGSGCAMGVMWGLERILFYNDAYAAFLGTLHPHALGRSGHHVWSDAWPAAHRSSSAQMPARR